jgi:hypothetical protein
LYQSFQSGWEFKEPVCPPHLGVIVIPDRTIPPVPVESSRIIIPKRRRTKERENTAVL